MLINLLFILSVFLGTPKTEKGKLILKIENVEEVKGNIALLLFKGGDGWPDNEKTAVREMLVPIEKKYPTIVIDSLEYGDYAVSLMQDLNNNNKMDENYIGLPQEPFGMSNIKSVGFTRPSYEEAKFKLNQKELEININLITVF